MYYLYLKRCVLTSVFLSMLGLIIACSPTSNDLQPTVLFEGSYKGLMIITTKASNQTFTQTIEDLSVQIKVGSSPDKITVQFFETGIGEISDPLAATVLGNTITIPKQQTPGYAGSTFEGTGTLSGKSLSLTVYDTYNGVTQVQTVTATKQ